jgi:signal transduction histidine kinase
MSASLSIEGEPAGRIQRDGAHRIAQEALNNTLKHSGAKTVSIHLQTGADQVCLEVADDGCGFDLDQGIRSGGLGLASMLERAAKIGANLEISTAPGRGTHVIVTIEEGL